MTGQSDALSSRESQAELRAALQARGELGPDMEDHVIDAFLQRIEQRVQAQVDASVAAMKKDRKKSKTNPTELVATSFGIAVPLMVIAGIFGGSMGIAAVAVMVVVINVLYLFGARD
jgi:Flp pilus assembly protein TadB